MIKPTLAGTKKRTILIALAALIVGLCALPASAGAVVKTWNGAGTGDDTDWFEPTNWTPAGAPTLADDAVIDSTSLNNPIVSATCVACTANSVSLSGAKTLTIDGGLLDVTLGTTNTISAPTGTNVTLNGGSLKFGTLTVDNASGLTMTGGTIAGILAASAATTLVNTGTDYNSTLGNVTLGSNVNVLQAGEVDLLGTATLDINSRTYTVQNSTLATDAASSINVTSGTLALAGDVGGGQITGGAATINIGSGTLSNSGPGTLGGLVEPRVRVTGGGTLSDSSSDSTGLILNHPTTGVTNELQGSLTTSGAGRITLTSGAAGNTYQLTGPLTVNQGGGAITIAGTGTVFDLENASNVAQTVTINGTLTWNATAANFLNGSGTITGPGGGIAPPAGNTCPVSSSPCKLLINGGSGTFEASETITVTPGARMEIDTGDIDLPANFDLTMNGTLQLTGGPDLTTSAAAADVPIITLGSTGTLLHTGSTASVVQAQVDSNGGSIQDTSTAPAGELEIDNDSPVVVNLWSGTVKTNNANSDVELSTGVFRLNGGLTFDTTLGGRIATNAADADLQMNNQTLTLLGASLEHEAGTISSNEPSSTINGPGTLKLENGDIATGVRLTVNAPVTQNSDVDLSGAGARLDIGGTWTSNADIRDNTGDTGLITVLPAGVLQHGGGLGSDVDPDLTINGKAELLAGAISTWDLNGTTTVGSAATVNVAAGSPGVLDINDLTNLTFPGGIETLTGGTYSVTGSGTLEIPDEVDTLNANVSLAGAGVLLSDDDNAPALDDLVTIGSSGKLSLVGGHSEAPAATLVVNGLLEGVGTILANVTNGSASPNSGTVGPGNSTGTLTVGGNYSQGLGGKLNIEVNGTASGQFDQLNVLGNVTLNGTVALLPTPAYVTSAVTGDFQPFIAYTGSRSGVFSTTTVTPPLAGGKPFTVSYNDATQRVISTVGQAPVQPPPPDTDGDGVPDSSDACPTQAGPAANGGCPLPADSDGDGVVDTQDACPTQFGLPQLAGCPKVTLSKVTQTVTPSSDSTAPYRYTVKGSLQQASAAAAGAKAAQANPVCSGKVTIRVKKGSKTVARKKATVKSNCTYRKRFSFSAKKLPGSGKLKFKATFGGNAFTNKKSSSRKTVSFG